MVGIATELRRYYRMALCSNALDDLDQVLVLRPDIRRLIRYVIVVSSEVGLRKPDAAILYLTARAAAPAAGPLRADRRQATQYRCGHRGGQCRRLTYQSPAQLLHELEERGLLQPQAQ